MNVYCVLSEMFEDGGGSYEPPEWGRLAVIVAAKTRGQARYLAVRSDRALKSYGPLDWPKLWCKRIGAGLFNPGVISDERWWDRVGDWNPEVGRRSK